MGAQTTKANIPDNIVVEYSDLSQIKSNWMSPLSSAHVSQRIPIWLGLLKEKFDSRPINMLEIGVFKGGWASAVSLSELNIETYTGVDPYMGDASDPYLGAYWQDKQGAEEIYMKTLRLYDRIGYQLVRRTSMDFAKSHEQSPKYDTIIIDGDHGFEPCLTDARIFWPLLKPGGMLMFDDYANSDHPGVTRAVSYFIEQNSDMIDKLTYFTTHFINTNKSIPVFNGQVALTKKV